MGNHQLRNAPYLREFLAELGGVKSIDIVGILEKRKEIDEFKLANMMKMDVKSIRKILYRLYERKLVSFRKTRDEQRGWYIYIWRLEPSKLKELMKERKSDALDNLKKQLEYEKSSQFFKCKNGCIRVSFDKAVETSFVCPECGNKLDFFDNSSVIKQMKQYIEQSVGG